MDRRAADAHGHHGVLELLQVRLLQVARRPVILVR
jgi:hypothetical protein